MVWKHKDTKPGSSDLCRFPWTLLQFRGIQTNDVRHWNRLVKH